MINFGTMETETKMFLSFYFQSKQLEFHSIHISESTMISAGVLDTRFVLTNPAMTISGTCLFLFFSTKAQLNFFCLNFDTL